MASSNNNQINIPEAKQAMYTFKHEVANELGVNLKQGYNGDLTSRDAGSIGGMMVKKMMPKRTMRIDRGGFFGLDAYIDYEYSLRI